MIPSPGNLGGHSASGEAPALMPQEVRVARDAIVTPVSGDPEGETQRPVHGATTKPFTHRDESKPVPHAPAFCIVYAKTRTASVGPPTRNRSAQRTQLPRGVMKPKGSGFEAPWAARRDSGHPAHVLGRKVFGHQRPFALHATAAVRPCPPGQPRSDCSPSARRAPHSVDRALFLVPAEITGLRHWSAPRTTPRGRPAVRF